MGTGLRKDEPSILHRPVNRPERESQGLTRPQDGEVVIIEGGAKRRALDFARESISNAGIIFRGVS